MAPSYLLVLLVLPILIGGQQIGEADDVSMLIGIFRESTRNPSNVDHFLSNPAFGAHFGLDEEWKKGPGGLTKQGKQQAYTFGQFLRHRYSKLFTNANEDILDYQIVKAFSASTACNQATLQLILAGLLPITDNELYWNSFNSTALWQPYVYSIEDKLTAASNTSCRELKRKLDQLKADTSASTRHWLSDENRTFTLFTERTGLNASLANLEEFGEFLHALINSNTSLPSWLLEPSSPPSHIGQTSNFSSPNSTGPSRVQSEPWLTKFLRFRQAHAELCSNDTDCRRLVAGFFLNHLLEIFMLKRDEKLTKHKIYLYSVNPDSMAAILALFQIGQVVTSPLGGLLIEYRHNPQPSVRFIGHSMGDEEGRAKVNVSVMDTTYCPRQEWCRLDSMLKSIAVDTFDDWDKACKTVQDNTQCGRGGGGNVALIRDALNEQDTAGPSQNGKKLKSTDCAFEWDKSGTRPCQNWASHGYCNLYDSVRWLFCRRTCLCNPEFL